MYARTLTYSTLSGPAVVKTGAYVTCVGLYLVVLTFLFSPTLGVYFFFLNERSRGCNTFVEFVTRDD